MVTVPLAYKTTFGSQKGQVFLNGKIYGADLAKTIVGMAGAEQEGWIWLKFWTRVTFYRYFHKRVNFVKNTTFVYCQVNFDFLCQKI